MRYSTARRDGCISSDAAGPPSTGLSIEGSRIDTRSGLRSDKGDDDRRSVEGGSPLFCRQWSPFATGGTMLRTIQRPADNIAPASETSARCRFALAKFAIEPQVV